MEKVISAVKTVWIFLLATVLVGIICWSVFTLTNSAVSFLKTCEQSQVKLCKIAEESSHKIADSFASSAKIPALLGNWVEAIVPPEAIEDLRKYTLEYWNEYGKEQMKDIFNVIKGQAAQKKLTETDTKVDKILQNMR